MKLTEKAQASLQKVIDRFQSGDLSPIIELAMIPRHPDDIMPSAVWTFGNRLFAYLQSNGQLDCRGFRQWEKVGRKVRKGASAVYIFGPRTAKTENDAGDTERRLVGFTSLPVFPLSETEGEDVPVLDYSPHEMPPLHEVAARLAVKVEYHAMPGEGHGGFYAPHHQAIVLGTHDNRAFWHELAHAAHAHHDPEFNKRSKEDKETVAEFCACVLAALYGQDRTGDAWHYIQQYADDPLVAIYRAMADIEKTLIVIGAIDPED